MIRFGTPVVDHKGRKHGILLLNYFVKELIGNLDRASTEASGVTMLVNVQGYWLKGTNPCR